MMDNELGQIMNVTIQGMDFTFKATEEILDLMVRFAACLRSPPGFFKNRSEK